MKEELWASVDCELGCPVCVSDLGGHLLMCVWILVSHHKELDQRDT